MSATMDLRPLHADMDVSEPFDDDNMALLNPSDNNGDDQDNNSRRRRRTPHRTNSKSTSSGKGSSSARRHSTSVLKSRSARSSSPKHSSNDQSHQSDKPAKNAFRRAVTTESAAVNQLSKTPTTTRRLFKRRNSNDMVQNNSGPCSASSSSSQKPKLRCPATVSSIAKPSLMEKLKFDAKFRGGKRGMPIPLPSVSGDSLSGDDGSSKNNHLANNHHNNFMTMDDTATTTSAPFEEPSEQALMDDISEYTAADDTGTNGGGGFFQFDPTKEDNVVNLVRTVTDDEGEEGTIFAMQEFKDKDDNNHETENDNSGESKHDNKLEKEGDNDLPPLVEAEGSDEEGKEKDESVTKGTYNFESHWNARRHFKDVGDDKPEEMVPELTRVNRREKKNRHECVNKEEVHIVEDSASCGSQDESSSSSDDYGAPQTAQGLLQFNHTTLDGLDLAGCAGDDTSIFQMNSISTLNVPDIMTTELSELDKHLLQLQQGQSKSPKERRSMFSGAIKKAKALKPKSLVSAAIGKGSKLLKDSTDHSFLSRSDNDDDNDNASDQEDILVSTDQTDNPADPGNRERSSTEDNLIEDQTASGDSTKDQATENNTGLERKNSEDATRRRRDRLKGRRESIRDKSADNIETEEERKERMRKRDALRKAATSENNPMKTPRQGRRRVMKVGDTSKLFLDHSSEVADQKDATLDASKESGNHIRRRSAMQKAQSVRSPSTTVTPRRAPVRRVASNDDGVGMNSALPHRTASGKMRRPSEAKFRREKDDNRDRSHSREEIERSHDQRSRRPRRPKDSEGKEEDEMDKSRESVMDKSRESIMDRSRESVDGSRERRRGGERRQARRSKRRDHDDNGGDEMDKSAISTDGNRVDASSSPGAHRSRRPSSMRPERTVDASFINLAGTGDILHGTGYDDLARQPPPIVDSAS